MTNDELLARLNEIGSKYCVDEGANKNACDEVHKLENALRVVVELFDKAGKWAGQPVISVGSLRNAIEKALL